MGRRRPRRVAARGAGAGQRQPPGGVVRHRSHLQPRARPDPGQRVARAALRRAPGAGRQGPAAELVPRPVACRRHPHRRDPGLRHHAAPAGRGGRLQAEVLRQQARLGAPRGQLGQHAAAHRAGHPQRRRRRGRRRAGARLRALRGPADRLGQDHHGHGPRARPPDDHPHPQRPDPRGAPLHRPEPAPGHRHARRPRAAQAAPRPHRPDVGGAQQARRRGWRHHGCARDLRPAPRGVRRPLRGGGGHQPLDRRARPPPGPPAGAATRPRPRAPRGRSPTACPTTYAPRSRRRCAAASARPSGALETRPGTRSRDHPDRLRPRPDQRRGPRGLRHRLAVEPARRAAARRDRGAAGQERGPRPALRAAAAAPRVRPRAARRQRVGRRHRRGGPAGRRRARPVRPVHPEGVPLRGGARRRRAPRGQRALGALARLLLQLVLLARPHPLLVEVGRRHGPHHRGRGVHGRPVLAGRDGRGGHPLPAPRPLHRVRPQGLPRPRPAQHRGVGLPDEPRLRLHQGAGVGDPHDARPHRACSRCRRACASS